MNDNVDETEVDDVVEEDGEFEETVVMADADPTDNVGDVSVEINVEQLVAEIEKEKDSEAAKKMDVRRKLEEVAESKSFEDTYAFEFDTK